jgi:hypothetical protein
VTTNSRKNHPAYGRSGGRNHFSRKNERLQGIRHDHIKATTKFKGNTSEMNGHVFQVFSESKNEKQFSKTYEMLGQYASKQLQYSGDLDSLFNNMGDIKKPTLKEPEDVSPNATTIQKQISAEKVKVFVQRTLILENNLKAMYAVIWGQCSKNMQNKVKTLAGFKEAQSDNDCVWLLKAICQITYNFKDHKYLYSLLLEAELNYMTYKQTEHESVAVYLENFRAWYEVFEHYG